MEYTYIFFVELGI